MRKYIFDVDGTLTASRSKIDPEFENWFEHFATHNACYLVTGSDRKKTLEQVGSTIYNLCEKVYNCSGNDVWRQDKNLHSGIFALPLEVEFDLRDYILKSKFPAKTGMHFDQRPGLVNFSILGRNNTLEERAMYKEWDEHQSERVQITTTMQERFPNILFEVAGDTGIDITLPGCDKSQIIRDFDLKNDYIEFFGDKMEPGGNDYLLSFALASAGQGIHQVKTWEETWNLLKQLA